LFGWDGVALFVARCPYNPQLDAFGVE
jgi:hypothetical protein